MENNKKKRALLVIFLALFVVCGLLFFWWWEARKHVWTNDAYIEGYDVDISADIEARIIKLHVDEGDFVKCGDPLCELDRSIYDAKKEEAITNVALWEKKTEVSKVAWEKTRDDYVVAKQEYENAIISYIEFDHFEKAYRKAEAAYKASLAAWENAKAQLGVILAWLKHTTIHAPMDGVIAKRWIWQGDVANIGQPLFVLNDLKTLWVTANLEETKLEHVKIGAPVKIHVDAYPDQEFEGHVFVIKASAASKFALIPPDNATGNFTKVVQRIPVKIWLNVPKNGQNYYFFPGMSCEVKIRVRK